MEDCVGGLGGVAFGSEQYCQLKEQTQRRDIVVTSSTIQAACSSFCVKIRLTSFDSDEV
jgi:hypothetical protein